MLPLVTAAALGLVLGLRHAFEPDHLAAVSTLVAERRGGFALGALWGLGHTISLLLAGAALFALRLQLSDQTQDLFELLVALMLIGLGLRALAACVRDVPVKARTRVGSLFVGLAHGLAGTGALTALAAAAMPTPRSCLAYMALFGLGSAVGMGAMTSLAGRALVKIFERPRARRGLLAVAGLASLGVGILWGAPRVAHRLSPEAPVAVSLR